VLTIRAFTVADIPFGMELKQQAGWNQLESDWQRYLALEPTGCYLAEWDGRPVGTVTTCVFGRVAWIAMMLVEALYRRKGIGRALMMHALTYLTSRGVRTVRLDATPLGQPLYEKLGFGHQFQLARYEGILPQINAPLARATRVERGQLADLIRYDAEITETERGKMLERLYTENPNTFYQVRNGNQIEGFLTARPGSNAWQIGPFLSTADAGERLLAAARHRLAGRRVFIDVPVANAGATAWVQRMGLSAVRYLLRMCRGEPVVEDIDRLCASSGPEKG
jgi:GNAT superfamily N-acetyltransferase